MFRNPQYHTTSQRILFSPIYKTCFFCWKYGGIYFKNIWILYFCYIFNKVTRFYVRFLRFNWFWKHCFEDRTRPKFASLYRYRTSNPIFEAISQTTTNDGSPWSNLNSPSVAVGWNSQSLYSTYVAALHWNMTLTRKVIYGCQMAIQGQGHFPKCSLLRVIPPVVWKWKGD